MEVYIVDENKDIVEVVRCKNCKYYGEVGDCIVHPHDGRFNANYYCADGDRKVTHD